MRGKQTERGIGKGKPSKQDNDETNKKKTRSVNANLYVIMIKKRGKRIIVRMGGRECVLTGWKANSG